VHKKTPGLPGVFSFNSVFFENLAARNYFVAASKWAFTADQFTTFQNAPI
jgi:hypothetical protein